MKESKIIIHNYNEELSDTDVLARVYKVMQEGLISETKKGKQYCFITRFNDGNVVGCNKTKTGYSFKIVKENYEI